MVQEKSGVGKTSMDNIEISEKKENGKGSRLFSGAEEQELEMLLREYLA